MSVLQHQSSLIEAAPVEQEGIELYSERKRIGPRALCDEIRVLSVPTGQARNNFYEINKINCLQDKHDVTL